MSRTGAEIRASESESKTIQDRISAVEKHLGQLCDTFGSYTRKTARLRDKGDLLCREITEYAEYEKWNPTLRTGMTQFAESLSAVQDYREAQVNRLEKKVVSQLSGYGLRCKQTKNDLKGAFAAQTKEINQKKKVETMKLKTPQNRQQISQAESELQRLSVDASRSQRALETQVEGFESKKIRDMKKVLRDFVNIELVFHAKALELYTQCYKTLEVIDPERDMEEFRKQVRPANTVRSQMARRASQQSQDSGDSREGSRRLPRPQQAQQPALRTSNAPLTNGVRHQVEDDSDEYEDDDDDDEDDEDDDDEYTEGESTARSTTINSRRR